MIYLDYNATSPLLPAVRAAMDAVGDGPLNPASVHAGGRRAKKILEDSRAAIAQALGAFANEVLFTSSGSEANNMVLRGFAADRALLVGATEHASVLKTGQLLGAATIPVDGDGLLDLANLDAQLANLGRPAIVSVQLANNETGVIQPITKIAKIVHAHGGLLHSDAVQALGKIPLDWGLLGADMLTLCAHKAGGPVGAGALLIRNDLAIKPLISGGAQELGRRAGTENIHAIAGFAALVHEVAHCPDAAKWLSWRDGLEIELLAACPEAVVFGHAAVRLPNTLMLTMPGVKSETQLMHFDLAGFALSAGSACSSGKMATSHVLLAMGVAPELASTAIRISFGWGTMEAEIRAFAECWKAARYKMGRKAA
ncbi:MAG: cysteine desulfurase family protein [Rickettsiales bacterium]